MILPTIDDLMREATHLGYFPKRKSLLIRFGVLDILHGRRQIEDFLATQNDLPDDLKALARAAKDWRMDWTVRVGESGTLYRFLMYASMKLGLRRAFEPDGTLVGRPISKDLAIIGESQRELLKRDGGTTQWASAAVLLGDPERLPDAPPELQLTYDAYDYWMHQCQDHGLDWEPRLDVTIQRQAYAFLAHLAYQQRPRTPRAELGYTPPPPKKPRVAIPSEPPSFTLGISEDFCFGFAFGHCTLAEGEARWPKLRGHESDRLAAMPLAIARMRSHDPDVPIQTPADHRVVQAVAMLAAYDGPHLTKEDFAQWRSVSKSWPRFWEFLDYAVEKIHGTEKDTARSHEDEVVAEDA